MFRNREEAAEMLAKRLVKYKNEQGVVLAVPRGAVPMGYHIAQELGFPLDIVLIKKIGHPSNPEFAIGAVSSHGSVVTNYPGVPKAYIEQETIRIKELLEDRYKQYVGNRQPVELQDKTVIIVDDGIATGNTMQATINLIKESKPKQIIVAVPVAPPEVLARLTPEVDEMICLEAPDYFAAVSQFYEYFPQVSDEEVISMLQHSWQEQ
jgi:putative phosphoribosyl transferase